MPTPLDRSARMTMLSTVPMFSSLGKKSLQTIADSASERTFNPGEAIVNQGEVGIGLFLVAEGQVNVEKSGKTVATLGPGNYFGEMALLDEQPRSANVRAASHARCLVLSPWEFWGTVGKDPEALRSLLKETIRRLRQSSPAPED